MKRDLGKAEEEEKWREKANKREQWKKLRKWPYSRVTNRPPSEAGIFEVGPLTRAWLQQTELNI